MQPSAQGLVIQSNKPKQIDVIWLMLMFRFQFVGLWVAGFGILSDHLSSTMVIVLTTVNAGVGFMFKTIIRKTCESMSWVTRSETVALNFVFQLAVEVTAQLILTSYTDFDSTLVMLLGVMILRDCLADTGFARDCLSWPCKRGTQSRGQLLQTYLSCNQSLLAMAIANIVTVTSSGLDVLMDGVSGSVPTVTYGLTHDERIRRLILCSLQWVRTLIVWILCTPVLRWRKLLYDQTQRPSNLSEVEDLNNSLSCMGRFCVGWWARIYGLSSTSLHGASNNTAQQVSRVVPVVVTDQQHVIDRPQTSWMTDVEPKPTGTGTLMITVKAAGRGGSAQTGSPVVQDSEPEPRDFTEHLRRHTWTMLVPVFYFILRCIFDYPFVRSAMRIGSPA